MQPVEVNRLPKKPNICNGFLKRPEIIQEGDTGVPGGKRTFQMEGTVCPKA